MLPFGGFVFQGAFVCFVSSFAYDFLPVPFESLLLIFWHMAGSFGSFCFEAPFLGLIWYLKSNLMGGGVIQMVPASGLGMMC
jgi:hypothetical protein